MLEPEFDIDAPQAIMDAKVDGEPVANINNAYDCRMLADTNLFIFISKSEFISQLTSARTVLLFK